MIHRLLLLLLLSFGFLSGVSGQILPMDVLSVEASIDNHKTVVGDFSSGMIAVTALETINAQIHDYSSRMGLQYREVSTNLEKYQKAFDLIDMILKTGSTVVHIKTTYDDCRESINGINALIEDYNRHLLTTMDFEISDTVLVNQVYSSIDAIISEVTELYQSCYELALYVTGKVSCRTLDMMNILNDINERMVEIRTQLRALYTFLYEYLTMRLGFSKRVLLRNYTVKQISADAFDRWKKKAVAVKNKLGSDGGSSPGGSQ